MEIGGLGISWSFGPKVFIYEDFVSQFDRNNKYASKLNEDLNKHRSRWVNFIADSVNLVAVAGEYKKQVKSKL